MTREIDRERGAQDDGGSSELERAVLYARTDGPSPAQLSAMAVALGLPGPSGGGGSQVEPQLAAPPSAHPLDSRTLKPIARAASKIGPIVAAAALVLGTFAGLSVHEPVVPTVTRAPQARFILTTPAPAAPSATERAPETPPPAPPPAASARKIRNVRRPVAIVPGEANTAEELALLERANSTLVSAPQRTLALVNEHTARYPHGAFAEEREVLAVQALLRLGRVEAAAHRAERLQRIHPHTAYAQRLDALLASKAHATP